MKAVSLSPFNISCATYLGDSASVHRCALFFFLFLITRGYFWLEVQNFYIFKHSRSFNFELHDNLKNCKKFEFSVKNVH